jgi:LacI family transcriptional regulator
MNQRINIDDIAQAAGVSKATVSQVLRNAGRISPETRKQVMQVASDLGYVYNRAAANLRAGQSTTIGIGVSSLSNPFFAELVSGAAESLEQAGYFPMIVNVEDDLDRQQRFATSLRENMCAGAVLCLAPGTSPKMLADWKAAIQHSVMVLRPPRSPLFDFVGVDNAEGSAAATEHLVGLGHKAIAYIGGTSISTSREARVAGWRQAMMDASLPVADDLVEPCGATIAAGSEAVRRVLKRRPDVTAIVCHQDIVAFGVTIGLRKLHLEPGRAVSVVGFDDISMSAEWDPALTTISVTPRTLGIESARLLLRRIAEPEASLQSIFIRPRLVVRASTSAVATGI